MVGWHLQLNGHEFEQTSGENEGEGSLACCSSQVCKESDMTVTKQQQQYLKLGISEAGAHLSAEGWNPPKPPSSTYLLPARK